MTKIIDRFGKEIGEAWLAGAHVADIAADARCSMQTINMWLSELRRENFGLYEQLKAARAVARRERPADAITKLAALRDARARDSTKPAGDVTYFFHGEEMHWDRVLDAGQMKLLWRQSKIFGITPESFMREAFLYYVGQCEYCGGTRREHKDPNCVAAPGAAF